MKRRRMVINYGAATARPDAGVSSILAADISPFGRTRRFSAAQAVEIFPDRWILGSKTLD